MADRSGDTFTGPISKADPAGTGATEQANIAASPAGDVDHPQVDGIEQLNRAEANLNQFPSLNGQTNVEIAGRSTDVDQRTSSKHRKVFRVFHGKDVFDRDLFDHAPNFNATRQFMLDNGLRPVGDVTLASVEDFDAMNVDLTYEVEAIPAVIATDPAQAHMVVSAQD